MAEIFFFADSFIAFFTGNCKALGTELTGVSHRSSLVGVQTAHMGLAGLDQIQQAGGVQRVFPGQALGGHGKAGGVFYALGTVQVLTGQQVLHVALAHPHHGIGVAGPAAGLHAEQALGIVGVGGGEQAEVPAQEAMGNTMLNSGGAGGSNGFSETYELDNTNGEALHFYVRNTRPESDVYTELKVSILCDEEEVAQKVLLPGESTVLTEMLTEKEKDEVAYRMAVYAAQVHCVDYNVGKLLDYLKKNRKLDNTLVMFLSDNGACAEPYAELGGGKVSEINNPACSVFPSYGRAWAQVSNTPFRKYKCRSYEGGISTPLIVSWKSNLKNKKGEWCRVPGYLPDIMPTILEATGVAYPETYHGGNKIYPLVGSSLFPAIQKKADSIHEYMYWEHQNNRAIRWGNWKAIRDEKGKEWELYDVVKDRTERNNLAEQHPEVLTKLVAEWEKWANSNFVLPKHPKK